MTPTQCTVLVKCLFLIIYVKWALNAKYSVSFCFPFLSGTLPSPELLTADLEEKLKELLTELERQRDKGE